MRWWSMLGQKTTGPALRRLRGMGVAARAGGGLAVRSRGGAGGAAHRAGGRQRQLPTGPPAGQPDAGRSADGHDAHHGRLRRDAPDRRRPEADEAGRRRFRAQVARGRTGRGRPVLLRRPRRAVRRDQLSPARRQRRPRRSRPRPRRGAGRLGAAPALLRPQPDQHRHPRRLPQQSLRGDCRHAAARPRRDERADRHVHRLFVGAGRRRARWRTRRQQPVHRRALRRHPHQGRADRAGVQGRPGVRRRRDQGPPDALGQLLADERVLLRSARSGRSPRGRGGAVVGHGEEVRRLGADHPLPATVSRYQGQRGSAGDAAAVAGDRDGAGGDAGAGHRPAVGARTEAGSFRGRGRRRLPRRRRPWPSGRRRNPPIRKPN